MSLTDLASIGSFISGLAVLVTLVILVLQTRQNTLALRQAEMNQIMGLNSTFRLALAGDRDLARIWTVGLSRRDTLDEIDAARFESLLLEFSWIGFHLFQKSRRGLLAGEWSRVAPAYASAMATSRGEAWWNLRKHGFPPDYVVALDAELAKVRANPEAFATFLPASRLA